MEEKWIIKDGTLCHHGIEGQKWGQRNGPPYPLEYNQASAAERKKDLKSLNGCQILDV